MSTAGRVTVEKLDDVQNLTERANFMSIQTSGATPAAAAGAGTDLKRYSLSRHEYGTPTSPCSPHSPRIGEIWRTGQASSHGNWFRPSPTRVQQVQQQQVQQ